MVYSGRFDCSIRAVHAMLSGENDHLKGIFVTKPNISPTDNPRRCTKCHLFRKWPASLRKLISLLDDHTDSSGLGEWKNRYCIIAADLHCTK